MTEFFVNESWKRNGKLLQVLVIERRDIYKGNGLENATLNASSHTQLVAVLSSLYIAYLCLFLFH